MSASLLVRYGRHGESARALAPREFERGERVVVHTHRGVELGTVLGNAPRSTAAHGDGEAGESAFSVLRVASTNDVFTASGLSARADREFDAWRLRIADWKLNLQLVDLEWTLDAEKLILYVLNDRGADCTRLAIQAAASGFGIIEVQPLSKDGPVTAPSGGGCGSCGCSH